MSLSQDSQFGNYHIGEVIGEGGMGKVFRATDTTLDRDVAIKVLPESFADDADRVARFDCEAKTLATLNHPNIAQIYGLEKQGDTTAIVMELVEGPTLADRIDEGPLPPDEALRIARQIIDGLEAAHDKGIVHRDLKPANIKVKDNGAVKILDFGIAKPGASRGSSGGAIPTLITPAVTETGIIMGTAAYMSPEQARGKAVDPRTDIWAFGCVLFEMLTGQPAFGGEDVMVVMASILRDQSDLDSIPKSISPAVRNTIKLCLEKDPKKRLHHIGDVRLAIAGELESGVPVPTAVQRSSTLQFWLRALPVAAVLAALAGFGVWQLQPEPARPVVRFFHELPQGRILLGGIPGVLAISPDGRRLVYNSVDGLAVRDLAALEDRLIAGTAGRYSVEFSPDGESLAYVRDEGTSSSLVRLSLSGGGETRLANWPAFSSHNIRWQRDGTLLVSRRIDGIWQVAENGGEPERLLDFDPTQGGIGTAQLLPGGDWLLFGLADGSGGEQVVAQSRVTGERRILVEEGGKPGYVTTGHLVYQQGPTLFAAPFNAATAELEGAAVPVVQNVFNSQGINTLVYAFADNGTLVYVPASGINSESLVLAVADGAGNTRAMPIPAGTYANPRVSPDGRWVAFEARYSDGNDIAVLEVGSDTAPRRLTFGGNNWLPAWSADSARVAYFSARTAGPGLYWRPGDGSGAEEQLTTAAAGEIHVPDQFSPDGSTLAWTVLKDGHYTLWQLPLATRNASVLIEAPDIGASHAVFSPDGRWLAYQAYDTGDNEIYVQPFPPTGARYVLPSRGDNHHPVWSPDGRYLYYIANPGRFERVAVSTERGVGFGTPEALLIQPLMGTAPNASRNYELMPDGAILGTMVEGGEGEGYRNRIVVVVNWFEELKRLVPVE